ncbi:MAG: DUF47 family protein [Clostridiaceae bacterium]|nr:DUF47 family protein [Clostridiaceae bacterium]
MRKGKEPDYFDLFIKAASICNRAAEGLDELLDDLSDSHEKSNAIHEIEHEGDHLYHEVCYHLNRSFITPIEREDIMEISRYIENTIDSIDDVAIMLDMMSIESAKKRGKGMVNLITKSCSSLVAAAVEFKNFKKSKSLGPLLVEINNIEEEGDALFQSSMKGLFSKEKDVLEIVKWQEIYKSMENVLDSCEAVADAMERVIIKNC